MHHSIFTHNQILDQCLSNNFSRFKRSPEQFECMVSLTLMAVKIFIKNCLDVHYFLTDFRSHLIFEVCLTKSAQNSLGFQSQFDFENLFVGQDF